MTPTINKGDKVAPLVSECFDGRTFDLAELASSKLLIIFFRDASCPFCNMHLKQLIENYEHFKSEGMEIVTFFASTNEEIEQYAGKQKAPFYIIGDPEMNYYKRFGIKQSKNGMLKTMLKPMQMLKAMFSGFFNLKSMQGPPILPSDFLITKEGTVDVVHHSDDYADHLSIGEIKHWLKKQNND
tara:strand:+ start:1293 stop:1844 length:552 start_codon:yes stop_codon:yes gene_type:complete